MPLTKPAVRPPTEIRLQADGQLDQLNLIGPSANGWVYRSLKGLFWYRLILLESAPVARRDHIRSWIGREMPTGVAAVNKAWQPEEMQNQFFCIRYLVNGMEGNRADYCSLVETLGYSDPCLRIDYAVSVLRALKGWWQWWGGLNHSEGRGPLLVLPADIVFYRQKTPYLLPLPYWQLPEIGDVFSEPARGLYFAPELVRIDSRRDLGNSVDMWENLDRYAMGAILLQCFHIMPKNKDGSAMLELVANGSIFHKSRLQSSLPFWLERADATKQAKAAVYKLIAVDAKQRRIINLQTLADELAAYRLRMDPYVAAVELRDNGRPFEAFSLIQDILLTEESDELLILAAEIAAQLLARPLEAVDLLERAINNNPQCTEAYSTQFKILSAADHLIPLSDLIKKQSNTGAQIDEKIYRDFQHMPVEEQQALETIMADYLLWRQKWDAAAKFIYPRLFDEGKPLWHKYELNLSYACALLGLKALNNAHSQLSNIRLKLEEALNRKSITGDEAQFYGYQLQSLEIRLMELKRQLNKP